jgi:peptidoglycan/xylan/chitin deacetylase (PgdA/CDA1 family)
MFHRVFPPEPKPLILGYHRIADEAVDPWSLAVSPTHFEEQLLALRRTRHPLPLTEFVDHLIADTLPANAVALTFDDGYVDNLVAAKPRLSAADVPATVFLATGYIGRLEPFWWDELARLVLRENAPLSFELVVRGEAMRIDYDTEFVEGEDGPIERRHAALLRIWEALRPLEDEERRSIMIELESIFSRRDHRRTLGRAMTREEVRALVAEGLVAIGAHTVTHPQLSRLGAAACHREITESKRACETFAGASVTAFAYPYGDFDADARETVKAAGFAFACSMQRGPVTAASDIFALPRIHVRNLDGDAFERVLRSASTTA